MMIFRIKQGDTRKALKLRLLDKNNAPVDLDGALVELVVFSISSDKHFRRQVSHLPEVGWVMVPLKEMHTDTPGIYVAEIHVTYPDGLTETFPTVGRFEIKIESRLNV